MRDRTAAAAQRVAAGPLSFQQRQIWLADQSARASGLYNESCALRLRGPLRLNLLEHVVGILVQRHEALRTTFPLEGGEPVQVIWAPRAIKLSETVVDLSQPPGEVRMDELLSLTQRHVEAPYDLEHGPLLRCSVFRLGVDDHLLLLGVHHIACDGSSLRLLIHELIGLYAELRETATVSDRPAPAGYLDFARTQHDAAGQGAWDAELGEVVDTLAGAPTALELVTDRPRPAVKLHQGRRDAFEVGRGTQEALTRLSSAAGNSRLAALTAAFAALVYRYTGRTDLVIGTGTDPRPARFADTVGAFANIVPLRLNPTGRTVVRELVDHACDAVFDALDHAEIPFEKVVEALKPARDPSHPQLVQLICTIWDRDYSRTTFADLHASLVEIPRSRARFDLLVEHVFDEDAWTMCVEYDTALFEPPIVEQVVRHYTRIIEAAAHNLDAPILSLPMLDPSEEGAAKAAPRSVFDLDGNVLPVGCVGELHELTRGTDGVAVPSGTGASARRTTDGDVETLGLLARRAKLGHLDVQLEYLETVLRGHPAVRDATIVLKEGVEKGPVAYVLPERAAQVDGARRLREYLAARLPRSWIPAVVMSADASPASPHSPSGAALSPGTAGTVQTTARTALESVLHDAWSLHLPAERIAPDDDFFALGGHSMLASQLAQEVGRQLGVAVGVRDVFTCPTIHELATELVRRHPHLATGPVPGSAAAPGVGTPVERSPVSMAQLQIWINEQLTLGAADDFNSAFAHRIRGPLDVAALRDAFQLTVESQPSLRTWFQVKDGTPEQCFADGARVDLPLVLLDQLPVEDRLAEALRIVREASRERFDIGRSPLLRTLLVRLAEEDHILAYTMHHLVTDGVSMGVFHRAVNEGYAAAIQGRAPNLPKPGVHYADYVSRERDWLAGQGPEAKAYWVENLAGLSELSLPTEARAGRTSPAVRSCTAVVPQAIGQRLARLARDRRATPFMTVTAGLAVVLQRWSGQRDLVVGTLVDNRPFSGLQDVMGCFANFVPLRMTYEPDLTFGELVSRVREVMLGAYEHQQLPFSEIVQAVRAPRSFTRMPLFQTTVQWVSPNQLALSLPGCAVRPVSVTAGVSRYELTLFVTGHPHGLTLDLEYAVDLWDAATIGSRIAQLVAVLDAGTEAPGVRLRDLPE
ncbi:condensation domain-containing protein [Streptomyces sp. NPDC050164]|uniref:condensation domain-containing protein n=1 Tax=Streptomyces sp. NPDC050164 TaxID=3365605 RepID=UPI0037BA12BB